MYSYLDCSQSKLHDNYFILNEIFVADLLLAFRFAKSIDICDKDAVVHKHTPYIVILVRLAENGSMRVMVGDLRPGKRKGNLRYMIFWVCWPNN